MEDNIEEPISPAMLAQDVGMSTRQLERLFRRYLNRSPKRYYMELRLEKARNLLMQTDMSVINVALACGFASPSHFSKCYRALYKTTPYRERGASEAPRLKSATTGDKPMSDPIVIVAAARTPMGAFQGALAGATAAELGGAAIAAALARAGIEPDRVDELMMGCVLPAGQGQAPARQAGFKAGLPEAVPATTLNKMCGSGMKAVMLAHDALRAGNGSILIAGGMESMSNAPYLLPKMRAGARLGHASAQDHMFLDGLEDAYDKGRLMGSFAEDCATEFQFTRGAQDEFALASLTRARDAQTSGAFAVEIAPVTVATRKGETSVGEDEQPLTARPEKIPTLKPAFRDGGTVTPANSSSISDGAAALVLMRETEARAAGLPIRARVLGHASHAQAPASSRPRRCPPPKSCWPGSAGASATSTYGR